ncbi:hypothetical protein NDU88_000396 [Pleurodeles waltl]|uniref:Uncharacterized protein n=1 Tax=Pleurodeles waltl TaxID=8319 RepID=A0AAV7V7R8_PLEWA|nr:hypothetical protein NDU88_000396 [Pleurodeles waltl]
MDTDEGLQEADPHNSPARRNPRGGIHHSLTEESSGSLPLEVDTVALVRRPLPLYGGRIGQNSSFCKVTRSKMAAPFRHFSLSARLPIQDGSNRTRHFILSEQDRSKRAGYNKLGPFPGCFPDSRWRKNCTRRYEEIALSEMACHRDYMSSRGSILMHVRRARDLVIG